MSKRELKPLVVRDNVPPGHEVRLGPEAVRAMARVLAPGLAKREAAREEEKDQAVE